MSKLHSIIGIAASFCLLSCSNQTNYENFNNAKQVNTEAAYQDVIIQYPGTDQALTAVYYSEKLQSEKNPPNIETSWLASEYFMDIKVDQNGHWYDQNRYFDSLLAFYNERSERINFKGQKGTRIAYDYFRGEDSSKTLVIVPGTGENSLRYLFLVKDLLTNGFQYPIAILNNRGQGFSERIVEDASEWNSEWDSKDVQDPDSLPFRKIYTDKFQYYVDDLGLLLQELKSRNSDSKFIGLGHSLGGGILTRYIELHPNEFESVVLSAPMHEISTRNLVNRSIIQIGQWFKDQDFLPGTGYFDRSKLPFFNEKSMVNSYTSSEQLFYAKNLIVQKYPETTLGDLTFGFVANAFDGVADIQSDAEKIHIPVLILQASNDQFVDNSGQSKVCEKVNESAKGQGKLCEIKVIPYSRHEILIERDSIRRKYLRFINEFWKLDMAI